LREGSCEARRRWPIAERPEVEAESAREVEETYEVERRE